MKVLVAFDGSSSSRMALELADRLPWPDGSVIRLVHVLPTVMLLGGLAPPPPRPRAVPLDLSEVVAARARPGIRFETRAISGAPVGDVLLAQAIELGADVIVAGHRGHGPIATALLGSVARDLVERSACPVLVARGTSCAKVLLAEDGSDGAYRARRVLVRWPCFAGVSATVLSVTPSRRSLLTAVGASLSSDARAEGENALAEARHAYGVLAEEAASDLRFAGVHATASVQEGDPAELIVARARELSVDLIVVGTRGRGPLTRAFLGSVARAVVLTAPCSVLVVPARRPGASTTRAEVAQ